MLASGSRSPLQRQGTIEDFQKYERVLNDDDYAQIECTQQLLDNIDDHYELACRSAANKRKTLVFAAPVGTFVTHQIASLRIRRKSKRVEALDNTVAALEVIIPDYRSEALQQHIVDTLGKILSKELEDLSTKSANIISKIINSGIVLPRISELADAVLGLLNDTERAAALLIENVATCSVQEVTQLLWDAPDALTFAKTVIKKAPIDQSVAFRENSDAVQLMLRGYAQYCNTLTRDLPHRTAVSAQHLVQRGLREMLNLRKDFRTLLQKTQARLCNTRSTQDNLLVFYFQRIYLPKLTLCHSDQKNAALRKTVMLAVSGGSGIEINHKYHNGDDSSHGRDSEAGTCHAKAQEIRQNAEFQRLLVEVRRMLMKTKS